MLSQSGGVGEGVSQSDERVTQPGEVVENQPAGSEIEVGLGAVSQFGAATGTGVGMGVGVGFSPEGRGFSGVRSPMMGPLASPLPVSAYGSVVFLLAFILVVVVVVVAGGSVSGS